MRGEGRRLEEGRDWKGRGERERRKKTREGGPNMERIRNRGGEKEVKEVKKEERTQGGRDNVGHISFCT